VARVTMLVPLLQVFTGMELSLLGLMRGERGEALNV
jgi:hypothetical protein